MSEEKRPRHWKMHGAKPMYFWNFFCPPAPGPLLKDHLLIRLILPKGVDGNQVGSGGERPGVCLGPITGFSKPWQPQRPQTPAKLPSLRAVQESPGGPQTTCPLRDNEDRPYPCWQVGIMSGFYNMALTRPLSLTCFSQMEKGDGIPAGLCRRINGR